MIYVHGFNVFLLKVIKYLSVQHAMVISCSDFVFIMAMN